jgi:hypothetical protein
MYVPAKCLNPDFDHLLSTYIIYFSNCAS